MLYFCALLCPALWAALRLNSAMQIKFVLPRLALPRKTKQTHEGSTFQFRSSDRAHAVVGEESTELCAIWDSLSLKPQLSQQTHCSFSYLMNPLALAAACAAAAPTQASNPQPPPPPYPPRQRLPRKCPRALVPVTQLSVWFVPPPSDRSNCINKRQKGPGCQAASIPCEIFIKLQLRDDKSAHCSTLWTALGHVPPSHEQSHFSGGRLCPSGVLSSMATALTNGKGEKNDFNTSATARLLDL